MPQDAVPAQIQILLMWHGSPPCPGKGSLDTAEIQLQKIYGNGRLKTPATSRSRDGMPCALAALI